MRPRSLLALVLLAAPAAIPAVASAQDVAASEALFNRGLADMQASKFDTGCPAIAESYRLDPRPGTLFTLAECDAKAGKVASADASYADYLQLFANLSAEQQLKQRARARVAKEQRAALAADIPWLTLTLPKDAPKGTVVTRDGVVLGEPSLGLALPIDPGSHVVSVQAPGGAASEARFTLARGQKKTLALEVKVAAPEPPPAAVALPVAPPAAPPPPLAPVASVASEPSPSTEPVVAGGSSRRNLALTAGGAGVLGLVVMAVFGGLTVADKNTIGANCKGTSCNHAGKVAADQSQAFGLVSTLGFAVGVGGVGTGVVLLLTAPSPPPAGARAQPPRD